LAFAKKREVKTETAGEEDTEMKANLGVCSDVPYVYDMKEGESGGECGVGKGRKGQTRGADVWARLRSPCTRFGQNCSGEQWE
jgi:hypothetical protein